MPKKTRENLIRIALGGAAGRMGLEIQKLCDKESKIQIQARIDQAADWKKLKPTSIDLVVEFSSPSGLTDALSWCVANNRPLVSGTTGLPATVKTALQKASTKIPILYSANMSLGIAVFSAMLEAFAALPDWEFQVEEAHHSQKKDIPSGTALLLQDKLSKVTGRKLPPPNSVRGGGIPGIHQVWAMGPEEAIVLQHTAFQRTVFARGALRAARWLFDKKRPGLYDLSDLYKMK